TAWRAARTPPLRSLASSSGIAHAMTARGRRTRLALVAVQVTVAVLLLMGSGLFAEQIRPQFAARSSLFDTTPIASATLDVTPLNYTESRGRFFFSRVLEDVTKVPRIDSAALADGLPGQDARATIVTPETHLGGLSDQSRRLTSSFIAVSPGF